MSPSCPRVQPPQLSLHVMPLPSSWQQPVQQSALVVHAEPLATQVGLHLRSPLLSGEHTPPQHTSPKEHEAPSGRQHTLVPPWPGRHSRGKVSVQHSEVSVHASPGNVHVPVPPKHREIPDTEGSHPVDPPPLGQQLLLAPMPQTSPALRQLLASSQRMIGRPSLVVPFCAHEPEQHWSLVAQISLIGKQPPRNSHVATPDPLSTQALEQHDPLMPGLPHGSPATVHAPRLAHCPTVAAPGRSQ